MKCAKCVEQGLRSTVSGGIGTVTCMGYSPYYDEDGVYHNHDPNIHTSSWHCSNGHVWVTRTSGGCPAPGCSNKMTEETTYVD